MGLELSSGINKCRGGGGFALKGPGSWGVGVGVGGWRAVSGSIVRGIPGRWTKGCPLARNSRRPGYEVLQTAQEPEPSRGPPAWGSLTRRGCEANPRRSRWPRTLCTEGNACHLVVTVRSCKSASSPHGGPNSYLNGSFAAGEGRIGNTYF